MLVSVTFEAANENAVGIFEQSSSALIKGFNNYFGGGGVWDSGPNLGGAVRLIRIQGSHKNTPPNGNEPWHPSAERMLYTSPMNRVIGYEDSTDMDFNDAQANISWQHALAPHHLLTAMGGSNAAVTDPEDASAFA